MEEDNKSTVQPATEQTTKKKSKFGKAIKFAILGFVGFIAIVIGIAFFATRGASNTAGEIISNLQKGNCSTIYNDQSNEVFKQSGSLENWNKVCDQISKILTGTVSQKGVNVSGQTGSASTSQVKYTIDGNDRITYDITVSMVKDNGTWKMQEFLSKAQQSDNSQPATQN